MKLAVLMACYNRVQKTITCLDHLYACTLPMGLTFDVYLVDDGSNDSTGASVAERYPTVHIIQGDGSLYWCGGMRLAWQTAAAHADYDGYMWLNDDTYLYKHALIILDHAIRQLMRDISNPGLIVGAVCDPDTGNTTYGVTGHPPKKPDGSIYRVKAKETINGNVVLVMRETWMKLGNLRSCFTHGMGDTDYGIRAQRMKIPIWLTPEHIGECKVDNGTQWDDRSLRLMERLRLLHSPKGCRPKEFAQIAKLIHPFTWPLYILKLYARAIFSMRPE